MTSMSMNAPPPAALTSPSQTSTATAPKPSQANMNAYIKQLGQTKHTSFPPLTDPLPTEIHDRPTFEAMKPRIPTDIQPYLNALTWMNKNIADSQASLAKFGGEGFEDVSSCPAIIQCIDAQKAQAEQDFVKEQRVLTAIMDQFNTSTALKNLMSDNVTLVKKSNDIQKQAQSGELLTKLTTSNEPTITYTLPPGANALADLEASDPATYQEYKTNYAPLFGLKTQFDQINRNLR